MFCKREYQRGNVKATGGSADGDGTVDSMAPEVGAGRPDGAVITDIEKCILCMACTHICTEQARIRPLPLQQKTEQMLGALKGVRNKNEVFL